VNQSSEISVNVIIEAMDAEGYAVFRDGSKTCNLNIVGIRSGERRAGKFDDFITVFWPGADQSWYFRIWPATTDPSEYWLRKLGSPRGTAILKPGQYRGAYAIGKHKTYEALRQVGKVTVFRDGNRDEILDMTGAPEESGWFGINIHRASAWTALDDVGPYSAGCQVFRSPRDFEEFMSLCRLGARHWGNRFTYTLMNESQIRSQNRSIMERKEKEERRQ
jgi:hypothetical protein